MSLPRCLLTALFVAAACATTIPTIGYLPNQNLPVFTNFTPAVFSHLTGASVSIAFGYQPDKDKLTLTYSGTSITGVFNAKTGTLSLRGRESTQAYVDAIRSVVFSTTADDGEARQITWTFGEDTVYLSATGHFYTYFPRSNLMWEDAVKVCSQTKFFDIQGYLATIASRNEYESIISRFDHDMWVGGTNARAPGTWRWVTGPEGLEGTNATGFGREFWTGQSAFALPQPGSSIDGAFVPWARFQPDNELGVQNYLSLRFGSAGMGFYDDAMSAVQSGYLCEYGGLEAPSPKIKDYQGAVTLVPGCSILTQSQCVANSKLGCAYAAGRCDLATCLVFNTEELCNQNFQCRFNTKASPPICQSTQCSIYQNAVTCNADTSCRVKTVGSTTQCVSSVCTDFSATPSTCSGIAGCTFLSQESMCVANAYADCAAMDIVFLVDGSKGMSETYGRHSNGFVGLMELIKNYSQSLPLGTGNTFGMGIGIVQFGANANYNGDSNGASTGTYTIKTTFDQIKMEAQKQWEKFQNFNGAPSILDALRVAKSSVSPSSRNKIIVIVTQSTGYTDAAAAKQYISDNNLIVYGITVRPHTSRDTSDIQARAALLQIVQANNYKDIELDSFAETLSSLCDAKNLWGTSARSPSRFCGNYVDSVTCQSNLACAWDNSAGVCTVTHCALGWQVNCASDPNCADFNASAIPSSCLRSASTKPPTVIPCMLNPNEDSCIADPTGCSYDSTRNPRCQRTKCTANDQRLCLSNPADFCSWNGQACYVNICAQKLNDQAACTSQPQCVWNNTCQESACAPIQDEKVCDENYACEWNVKTDPSVCAPRRCGKFNLDATTAKANCNNDPACYWSPQSENLQKDQCVKKTCANLRTSCDCASMSSCIWREGKCRENRFVQCPAIDLVFLMEGSRQMTQSFGRHRNGFAAMIQNIRKWAKDAPLVDDPNKVGFRVATVQYGPENVAGTTSRDVGGGGNVTGDLSKVLAELEWHDKNLLGKNVMNLDAKMYIQQSLQKAGSIFKTSPRGTLPRTRIIMVMGNSLIRDGLQISNDVNQLSLDGVSIFSNQIRRFDAITALDRSAGSMLKSLALRAPSVLSEPIASDASSTNFLYATVDNINPLLLQKFCDPTTNVGQALDISRSGDIPCGWLSNSDECSGQRYCQWDPAAITTCPETDQCPQLGCLPLGKALTDAGYTCANCKVTNGAFDCSKSNDYSPVPGACVVSTCTKCQGDGVTCTNTCKNASKSGMCERNICSTITQADACNKNYGCSWNPAAMTCVDNTCSKERDVSSCAARKMVVASTNGKTDECEWITPKCDSPPCPQLCRNQPCPYYTSTPSSSDCESNPKCLYDFSLGCLAKPCDYGRKSDCDDLCVTKMCGADPNCYYDPQSLKCNKRGINCVVTKEFGPWTDCSAACGTRSRQRTKKILQYPEQGGTPCPDPKDLIEVANCSNANDGDRMTCQTFCSKQLTKYNCTRADPTSSSSCYWDGSCKPRVRGRCRMTAPTADKCNSGCKLVGGMCVDDITVCQYDDSATCTGLSCSWIEPKVNKGTISVIYNPGDKPRPLFVGLSLPSTTLINGAVVYIQDNYQVGKDILVYTNSDLPNVNAYWNENAGALHFSGTATIQKYAVLLQTVSFFTASTSQKPRTVSWSLGKDTFYHSETKHFYNFVESTTPMKWLEAKQFCNNTAQGPPGYTGYLATVTSEAENQLITTKLEAFGWLAGSDASEEGTWKWTTGENDGKAFWQGGPPPQGQVAMGSYAKWEPPTPENQGGEPSNTLGSGDAYDQDYLYLKKNGYWADQSATYSTTGMICEFKGLPSDAPLAIPVGGSSTVVMAGCFPQTCAWHKTGDSCVDDVECMWNNGACIASCATGGNPTDCDGLGGVCRWNTDEVPPACKLDACAQNGMTICEKTTTCRWDGTQGKCVYRTGCEKNTVEDCNKFAGCAVQNNFCMQKSCSTYSKQAECQAQRMCLWKPTSALSSFVCVQKSCEHIDSASCSADSKCNWLQEDSQAFLGVPPGGTVVQPFLNTSGAPATSTAHVDGATVTIAEGFESNSDTLLCDATDCPASVISVSYDAPTLFLKVVNNQEVSALRMFKYVEKVKFRTVSISPRRRTISFALGDNMAFLPGKGGRQPYYYKVFPKVQATSLNKAQQICSVPVFGLTGFVATILEERESIALRLLKAKGILGATDTPSQVWTWTATGQAFWKGYGSLGTPNSNSDYALWNLGQPAGPTSSRQSAFLMTDGSWVSTAPSASIGFGVICQYGNGTQAPAFVAGGTRGVAPSGCFPRVCGQLTTEPECRANYLCDWRGGQCMSDERCGLRSNPTSCNTALNCFWDYERSACLPGPTTMCNALTTETQCSDTFFQAACAWDISLVPAACTPRGCSKYPFKSICSNNPRCRWLVKDQLCIPRLCGYIQEQQCWQDPVCIYDYQSSIKTCTVNPCYNLSQADCQTNARCALSGTTCTYSRCQGLDKSTCALDPACLFKGSSCYKPVCDSTELINQTSCEASKDCYFDTSSKKCMADQCRAYNQAQCTQDSTKAVCLWSNTFCRHKTVVETFSSSSNGASTAVCAVQEVQPNLWWVWLLLFLILVGLTGVLWRLYLAYKYGYSFTDPARYTKKCYPHEEYAKELGDVTSEQMRYKNSTEAAPALPLAEVTTPTSSYLNDI